MLHDVGEDRERRPEVAREHFEPDRGDLALDAAVERDAEIAERALDGQRRARLRAEVERPHHHRGGARRAGRIGDGAGAA